MLSWILRLAAIVVPLAAVAFARVAGASWLVAVGFGLLTVVAVYLASRAPTPEAKAAELGRGVIVSVILTIVLFWVQHEGDVRAARDNLALTLSSGRQFVGIDLHGRELSEFYLAGKDLSEADLHDADLRGAVLRGAILYSADLHGADLSRADLRGARFDPHTDLSGARLANANLTQAHLSEVRLAGGDLRGADLTGAVLPGADLRDADLRDVLLVGADLRRALLVDVDLRGAVLEADGRNAQLERAGIRRARSDSTTRWPPGFPQQGVPKPEPIAAPEGARTDYVTRVVDGDSVVLRGLGNVRLLGIDAPQPESRPRDCFGAEAAADVRQVLPPGQEVRYTLGASPRDKFGRALAYLWLPDGRFVNEEIVARGDATVLIVPPNTAHADRFRDALVRAAAERRGLWKEC